MATYKDLQDRINLDYLNQMTLIPETKRAIASAIRCYENQRFWFNETATVVALVSSQSYLTVPADFLWLDRLEVSSNSNRNKLRPSTFADVRDANSTANYGLPTQFAYRGNRFELSSIPDSAYAATVCYVHSLPPLSADTDTNAWTTEGFNLIAHVACIDLLSNVIQVLDPRKVNYHTQAADLALRELFMRNENAFSNRIVPTYF